MNIFWMSIAVSVIFAIILLAAAQQLLVTFWLYRRMPWSEGLGALRYTLRTRNAWTVVLMIVTVGIFCVVLPLQGISYPKIILLPVALLQLNVLALYGTPPSVLLLGSSRWENVRLFNLIERGIYPYRVVVLLEPSQTEPARHSRSHWMHFEVDNLRVLGPHSWREIVHRIARSVPLIVLDTRFASPGVNEETKQMIRDPFRDKTLFVVADDGSAPSFAATNTQTLLPECRTARLQAVVSTLRDMGLSKATSPDDAPLLAQASYARNSKKMERGMAAVARAGIPFAAALESAERSLGCSSLVMAARKLQKRLNGGSGDGALAVLEQLSDDIAEIERFISQWRYAEDDENQEIIVQAQAVHRELCRLQQTVDQAPPVFLQRNEEILRGLKRE